MKGMNAKTGRWIDGVAHLGQSIGKCLTTALRTRIARRQFGSQLVDLIDAPNNPATRVRLYAAVATVLMKYEPRLRITRVTLTVDQANPGAPVLDIEGTSTISNDAVSVSVPLTTGGTKP